MEKLAEEWRVSCRRLPVRGQLRSKNQRNNGGVLADERQSSEERGAEDRRGDHQRESFRRAA
jgi:hypothetical protein